MTELRFAEIRRWDAGSWFDPKYAGEKVPALEEVLAAMREHPHHRLYFDLKEVDLDQLGTLVDKYQVAKQIILSHNNQENLIRFRKISPEVRTMLWIGGSPEAVKRKFEKVADGGFQGLDQVQLHLHRDKGAAKRIAYLLEAEFLKTALRRCNQAGVDLELLPFEFDETSVGRLLELGIRWYATDYPRRFVSCVARWGARRPGRNGE